MTSDTSWYCWSMFTRLPNPEFTGGFMFTNDSEVSIESFPDEKCPVSLKPVIVYGTNDVSQLAAFYLENDSSRQVAGHCVDREFLESSEVIDKPLFAFEDISPDEFDLFIPLYDSRLRELKAKEAKEKGFTLVSYVSSKATVWSPVGENCFIMEDNTIQPFVKIGNNIVMWSGNHIGHHSIIEDNVFFSSHVVLSGHCVVKSYCWLGVNSTIRDHITLAEGTFIGMGSVITKDTEPNKRYAGSPARQF
jgi:sugar O-acyltransferase (sialic acid O-acetyltransferase NeuD family)